MEQFVDQFDLNADDIGGVLNEAASYLRIRGDYLLAEEMHLRALALARKSGQKGRIATSLNNLAFIYNDVGEPERALPLFQEALQLQEEELGESDPGLWLALHNLGRTYLNVGQLDEAYKLAERALELAPKETDEDVYFRAFVLTSLAEVLCAMGRGPEALISAREGLDIRLRSGNPQRIAASYSALGQAQSTVGAIGDAIESLRSAVELGREVYGPDHPILRRDLKRLAEALRQVDREVEADEVQTQYEELTDRLSELWPNTDRAREPSV
ncbi:MAG: tetratricopeptide repeat protein [Gammaproteobacteria bacterium]